MSTLRRSLLALASLAAGLAGCNDQPLPSAPRDAAPRATLYSSVAVGAPVMLGSLPGTTQDIPHGINEAGTITGVSAQRVAIWATGPGAVPSSISPTTPTSAADPGIGAGWGHDINNSGQIAGEHGRHAALWTPDGAGGYIRTDIPLPGSPDESIAWGINDGGKVVGTFRTGLVSQCFLWTPSDPQGTTGTTSVPSSNTGGFCVANDINSLGTIAGTSAVSPVESHAFVWDGVGALTDLTPGGPASYGAAINDGGQVAGWRLTSNAIGGVLNAAIWTPAGSSWDVTDLGTFGHDQSYAMDIDDAGFVVGFARNNATTPATDDAFFWEKGSFHPLDGYTGFPSTLTSTTPTALTNVSPANVVVITGATGNVNTVDRVPLRWAVTLTPATPQGCIAALVTLIEQMRTDGTLRSGEAKSLLSKLDAATRQIDQGKTTPAKNILYAFINEVNALVASGRLTSTQAQPLIDGALCAIAGL